MQRIATSFLDQGRAHGPAGLGVLPGDRGEAAAVGPTDVLFGRGGRTEMLDVVPDHAWRREAVFVLDERGRVVEWNAAAELIFGFERAEVIGRMIRELVVPQDAASDHERRFANLAGPDSRSAEHTYTTEGLRSTGQRFPVAVRITRTRTTPVNFVVSVRDISGFEPTELAHRRLQAMLDFTEDAMALLALDGRILSWNRAAESLTGFSAGEVVGDEFAHIFVPDDRLHEPAEWLPRLAAGETLERETERLHKSGKKVWVSIRLEPFSDADGEVAGAIWVARDTTDRHRLEEREMLDAEAIGWRRRTQRAIVEGSFTFAAQPIFDLGDGGIDHYELLLRMKTEDGGIAMPNDFLPHAERSGLIRDIDLWAVRKGIALARHHPVAINLSGASIAREDLLLEIGRALTREGVDPARVTFELTETAAADDIERAGALVERLAALGCGIALDDFGTGFGTFTYLSRLPVTELKIDREFVSQVCGCDTDRRVVTTMIAVARNFGMRTVAEGIEDEEHRQVMTELGTDLGQGYLFGKPVLVKEAWGIED